MAKQRSEKAAKLAESVINEITGESETFSLEEKNDDEIKE